MKLLLSILLSVTLLGAEVPVAPQKAEKSGADAPCCRTPLALGAPSDKSIYLVESKWTSDRGATIPLSVLRGRPQVVAMFFSNCEYACPILVNDMKRIETQLRPELREKVDFALVSFDSARDTVEALAAFRKRVGLAVSRWSLLRGEADDVRELAALLGINYVPDARGQFAHTNVLTLLNAEGEIVFQQAGLNSDPTPMLEAIKRAVAAK